MSETHCLQLGLFESVHNFIVAGSNNALTDEHWTNFERLLRESDDACRLYAQYVGVSVLLPSILSAISSEESPEPDVFFPEQQEPAVPSAPGFPATIWHGTVGYLSSGWPLAYLIATVLFTIGLLIGHLTPKSHPVQVAYKSPPTQDRSLPGPEMQSIGRITGMVDCRWTNKATEPALGAAVPLGHKFAMASGLMEITYDTGAKVILQGPVTYEVESRNGGFTSVGKLTAKVETEKAKGFCVRTPTATVTDLGTEFGVEVTKSGETTSQVFRGSVRVQRISLDGRAESDSRIVGENQAVRVESSAGNLQIVSLRTLAPSTFIRQLPKRTIKTLDLVDVVAGGDGFGNARGRGIDPATGMISDKQPKDYLLKSDGRYHKVDGIPFVDGVFIPHGRSVSAQLDSAGHVFTGFLNQEDTTWGFVWAGGVLPNGEESVVVGRLFKGLDYSMPWHSALYLHANKAITFDIDAVRRANPRCKPIRFTAVAGKPLETYSGKSDVWVFVDGKTQFCREQFTTEDGELRIAVPLNDQNRFLTLAVTDGGDGIRWDVVVFGDPKLTMLESLER